MNPAQPTSSDAICLTCGYSLAGLAADGNCPECQTPIERSIRGGGLAAASSDYVTSLRNGATLTFISVFVDVLWFVGLPVLTSLSSEGIIPLKVDAAIRLVTLIDLVGIVLGTWGWWMLSSPDPASAARFDLRSRRILRAMLALGAVWAGVYCVVLFVPAINLTDWHVLAGNLQFGPNTNWTPTLIVALSVRTFFVLLRFVRFWVGLWYLRSLAARIPSEKLHKRCTRQLWTIPLWSTLGCALLMAGPIVAISMYCRTLWLFRKTLGDVLKAQRAI